MELISISSVPQTKTVDLTFSDQQLIDIIHNARSLYWLDRFYELTPDQHMRILTNSINGETVVNKRVGPREIAAALGAMFCTHPQALGKIIAACPDNRGCYADGPTCDLALQVAVFGAVVFG